MLSLPVPTVTPLTGGPTLRWGVLAPGVIANDFVSTLHANTEQRVHAVASRSTQRAAAFASSHGIPRSYGSYEQLVADPDIDVVCIASPHSEHRAMALLAIEAGKHVLIQKPIALNEAQAQEIADAARAAGVFAMEALWTRYLPQSDVIAQLLHDGALGDVTLVSAVLGWKFDYDPVGRGFDPALGGGAMLDAGVYSHWFAQFVLGEPTRIQASGNLAPTGVDTDTAAVLEFADGALAAVTSSIVANTPVRAAIFGTAGSIEFDTSFVNPSPFRLTVGDASATFTEIGPSGRDGLAWQATALAQYVAEGRTESPVHSLDDSIALMRTIDEVRRQVGAR
jgi:predicted dehydrogenase